MKTVLIAFLLLTAQTPPPVATAASAPTDDYVVGIGDVLSFRVFGEDDATRPSLRIEPDGTVEIPHLGRITVTGKTARQIKEFVEGEYIRRKLYTRPSVDVNVTDFRSQTLYVMGPGVKAPKEVPVRGFISITEAISQAGWFNTDASEEVLVYRGKAGERPDTPLTQRTPDHKYSKKDIEEGRLLQVRVGGGDTIFVGRADVFFITGQVKAPQTYTLKPGLTVYQAVYAMAGGLTDRGAKGRIYIMRIIKGKETKVDIKNINTHVILPNDTIVVPPRRW